MNILNFNEQQELFAALLYCNISELKNICIHFELPTQGEKIKLIENIQLYVTTGKIAIHKEIPASSKTQPKTIYPLAPNTLMLKGSFKNDLKTRIFLKNLIGNHFHYTAYGIDWIKHLWMQGTPPTYAQFAMFWQSEHEARQKNKAIMKPEWAYLNFLDHYKKIYPTALKSEAITAWNFEREIQVKKVNNILFSHKI